MIGQNICMRSPGEISIPEGSLLALCIAASVVDRRSHSRKCHHRRGYTSHSRKIAGKEAMAKRRTRRLVAFRRPESGDDRSRGTSYSIGIQRRTHFENSKSSSRKRKILFVQEVEYVVSFGRRSTAYWRMIKNHGNEDRPPRERGLQQLRSIQEFQ